MAKSPLPIEPPPVQLTTASEALPLPEEDLVVVALPLRNVEAWPMNPRKVFKQAALQTLASSMAGPNQVQPIQVRPFIPTEPTRYLTKSEAVGIGWYQIIDGERRWRSLRVVQSKTIRAIVVYPRDVVEHHRMSVIANMHREPHSHYENACAVIFQAESGRNVKQMAADFSKSEAWIRSYLSLRALQPELFELMSPTVSEREQLPYNHALLLAQIKLERQAETLLRTRIECASQGPRGVLTRLHELSANQEYRALTAPGTGGKRRGPADTAKLVRRAVAAVQFNAASLLRLQPEFEKSLAMRVPANREAVAKQIREATEVLLAFSKGLTSNTSSS